MLAFIGSSLIVWSAITLLWTANIPDDWPRKREDIESRRYREVVTHAEATGYMLGLGVSTGWRTTGTHSASYCAGFEDSRET